MFSVITNSLIFIFILYCKPRGDNVKLWIALIIWAVSFIKLSRAVKFQKD